MWCVPCPPEVSSSGMYGAGSRIEVTSVLGMNAVALVFFGCINVASVKQLLPQSGWAMALPVYYIALTTFVLLKIRGFFRKNQKQYRKFSTKATRGMAEDHTSCCFHYYCSA